MRVEMNYLNNDNEVEVVDVIRQTYVSPNYYEAFTEGKGWFIVDVDRLSLIDGKKYYIDDEDEEEFTELLMRVGK